MVDQNPSARIHPVYFLLVALLPSTPFFAALGDVALPIGGELWSYTLDLQLIEMLLIFRERLVKTYLSGGNKI